MVEGRLAAHAPRSRNDVNRLRLALAAGGVFLVAGSDAEGIAEMLEAEPGPLRLGRLSEHAGGQGHLAAWACLAFGLTPFDMEPQAARLAAFAEEAGPAALVVEFAERLTDAEIVALAGIASRAGIALLLLGGDDLARRALEPALAGLGAFDPSGAAPARTATKCAAAQPTARIDKEPRDAFGLIAAAVVRAGEDGAGASAKREPTATRTVGVPSAPARRRPAYARPALAAVAAFVATATAAMMVGVAPQPSPNFPGAPAPLMAMSLTESPPPVGASSTALPPAFATMSVAAPGIPLNVRPQGAAAPAPRLSPALFAPDARASDRVSPPATALQAAPRLLPPDAPAPGRASPVALAAFGADGERSAAFQAGTRVPAPRPRPAVPVSVAPPSQAPWVVIHHAPESRALAEALSVALTSGVFSHVALREVGVDISADQVRYYFAEDGALAGALSAALEETLGSGVAIRDFTGFERLPGRMTLEVWLADGAG